MPREHHLAQQPGATSTGAQLSQAHSKPPTRQNLDPTDMCSTVAQESTVPLILPQDSTVPLTLPTYIYTNRLALKPLQSVRRHRRKQLLLLLKWLGCGCSHQRRTAGRHGCVPVVYAVRQVRSVCCWVLMQHHYSLMLLLLCWWRLVRHAFLGNSTLFQPSLTVL